MSCWHKLPRIVLAHLLPNAAAIASQDYASGHVHQARVAIRRLRSALKIFAQYDALANHNWESQLARPLFSS